MRRKLSISVLVCAVAWVVLAIATSSELGASDLSGEHAKNRSAAFRFCIGPNLFVDDYLIAGYSTLKRTTHQPAKLTEPVLQKIEPWHTQPMWILQIAYDPGPHCFRMWYSLKNPGLEPSTCFAYAESTDGINWIRPDLGLLKVASSSKNNFIAAPLGCLGLFLVDEGANCVDASRRYKLAYFASGLAVAFSPDGLRFTEYPGNPLIPLEDNGTAPVLPGLGTVMSDIVDGCWDSIKKEYLIGCKVVRGGYPGKPLYNAEGYRRCVAMTRSTDFIHWDRPRVIVFPDPANGLEEFYGFQPMVRGNLYMGFVRVLRDDISADTCGPVQGVGWTEIISSRDGRKWTRYQDKFIDRNLAAGTWDHAVAWYADCVTVGDKDFVYYGGYSIGHKVGDRQVGVAFLRKNGFVSRDAGDNTGLLKTPFGKLTGVTMTVNACVQGEIRVRLVGANGKALPGFDWTNCAPIKGDSVSHSVIWKGSIKLPQRKTVSLEFSVRNAELYGFDLVR